MVCKNEKDRASYEKLSYKSSENSAKDITRNLNIRTNFFEIS